MTTTGVTDLAQLADELQARAADDPAGRAARTLAHPVDGLRQTVIALRGGAALSEHPSPGPASLLVLRGRVRLLVGDDGVEVGPQQHAPVPLREHSLSAEEDAVVLLTVVVPDRIPGPD